MPAAEGRLIIITGMSGAGKSSALRCFEDLGFCCIDNLPPSLIDTFVHLYRETPQRTGDIAIVCDVRSGELFGSFREMVGHLNERALRFEVLFLDCENDVLLDRFKETRRRPPLGVELRVEEAIALERQRLDPLKELATVVVDTSNLTPQQLRDRLFGIYAGAEGRLPQIVTLLSFGFKYGIPADADFVFDTRFIRNPYYVENLRDLSGNDQQVREYVLGDQHASGFIAAVTSVLGIALPQYDEVHQYNVMAAFGCTGGRHRSVALANAVAGKLVEAGYHVVVQHRDLMRP